MRSVFEFLLKRIIIPFTYVKIEKSTGQTRQKIIKLTANSMYGVRNSDNFIFSFSLQSLLERK